MKYEDFNKLVEVILDECRQTLSKKATEYATDADRLHNFKQAAAIENSTPEKALRGMLTKHIVSVYDMITQVESGKSFPLPLWREKCGDIRNYMILLEALVAERTKNVKERCEPEQEGTITLKNSADSATVIAGRAFGMSLD
jgi:hypothetical protein